MQQRQVGNSGLQVSRLGLGTLGWGTVTDPTQARQLVKRFADAGGNLIDTAPAYGSGMAERILGSIMRHVVPRERLVLATKAGFGTQDGEPVIDTSRRGLLADLAASLKRLGTDHVDIWQLHVWGDTDLDETLAAMDQAVAAGMARYIGVCNLIGWQLGTAATMQQQVPGRSRIVVAQNEYSLLSRRAETEILGAVGYHEMGFFPWSPIGRGVLAGRYSNGIAKGSRAGTKAFKWFVEPYLEPRPTAIVTAVEKAAQGLGMTTEQVAMLWVRDAPMVTAPLLGPRTVEQLQSFLDVESQSLPDQIVAALDDVSGGANLARKLPVG